MKKVLLFILSIMILLPVLVGQDYYKVTKQTRISTGMDEAVAVVRVSIWSVVIHSGGMRTTTLPSS